MKLAILTAWAGLLACPAVALECAPYAEVVTVLSERYGETLQTIGVDGGGNLVAVWTNSGTGSWSITVSEPDMTTCLIGAGNAFEAIHAPSGEVM